MAPAPARLWVPNDRMVVITIGRPVGIAETANATELTNSACQPTPRHSPMRIEAASATPAMTSSWRTSALIWRVSGVSTPASAWSNVEMWPTSVALPIAVTTIRPEPRVTLVFMNAMPSRSPSGASTATGSVVLATGRLSPVRAASSISSELAGADDPAVGRDHVARLDGHDVARDQLVGGDLDQRAVADERGCGRSSSGRGRRRPWRPCPPGRGRGPR